jgi:hypothetical protein
MKKQISTFFGLFTLSGVSVLALLFMSFHSQNLYAEKGSSPIYQDPFDVAAGGASLTRASQAGIIFSNPSLLSFGNGFHRWIGTEPTIIAGKDGIDLARSLSNGVDTSDPTALVDKLLKTPVYAGTQVATTYANYLFGVSIINRIEIDLKTRKYGQFGLPDILLRGESYQGAGVGVSKFLLGEWLSIGATGKYLLASEPNIKIDITDQDSLQQLSSPDFLKSQFEHNRGIGLDVGTTALFAGEYVDTMIAAKVDDFGTTKLQGGGTLKSLPQAVHAGFSLLFHNSKDSIVFSVDYRDITRAYDEPNHKRFQLGTKVLLRKIVGVAAGYYDGRLSYGAEVDLFLLRLTATQYTRELAESPGVDSRPIYMLGLAVGF